MCFNNRLVEREIFLTDPFKRWVRHKEERQKSNILGKQRELVKYNISWE